MTTQEDITAAVVLLRSHGYSVLRKPSALGTSSQRLFVCRWGTMSALVWAQSHASAEQRVRHGVFDRKASLDQVVRAPELIKGEVFVREATPADLAAFEECGGNVPA